VSVPSDPASVTQQGWAAVPNWLVRDPSISRNVKLVYLVLSSRVDRDGVCYPSQGLISTETGLSVATVKRAIAEMRRRGLLTVALRTTARGRHNVYHLHAHPFAGEGVGSP
jgi:hypothetical protein